MVCYSMLFNILFQLSWKPSPLKLDLFIFCMLVICLVLVMLFRIFFFIFYSLFNVNIYRFNYQSRLICNDKKQIIVSETIVSCKVRRSCLTIFPKYNCQHCQIRLFLSCTLVELNLRIFMWTSDEKFTVNLLLVGNIAI